MARFVVAWLLLALPVVLGSPARAQPAVDAAAVRSAASAFDAGSSAYRAGRYEEAASSFEAADQAVPSARALRMAMRSREQAGQAVRAATLAGQALRRYRSDAKTRSLAHEIVEKHRGDLHKLAVSCVRPCVLAVGRHSVPGQARRRWTVFVEPGPRTISASFIDVSGTEQQQVQARAGGHNTLSFIPRGGGESVGAGTGRGDGAEAGGADAVQNPDGSEAPGAAGGGSDHTGSADDDGSSWIASPGIFIALTVATVGVAGVTVWSGIDTVNDPGTEAVQQACAGQGTDCPEYQRGRSKQTRTNVLIGATAGAAVLTAVMGMFVTDWGDTDDVAVSALVDPCTGLAGAALFGRF